MGRMRARFKMIASHRLEFAIERDVDQHRTAARDRLPSRSVASCTVFARSAATPNERCQRDEIDRRVGELHADVSVGLVRDARAWRAAAA